MTDVVVIGGGIAGCSTALFLAEDDVDVVLLERGDLNAGASGGNAGSLHAQIQHEPFTRHGDAWAKQYLPAVPFFRYAVDLWEELDRRLDAELEFSRNGGIIVAATDAQMREVEAKTRLERANGLGTELLDGPALRELAPYISDSMIGGAYCPVEGKASPLKSTTALATAAEQRGARMVRNCAVRDIRRTGRGYRVDTSRGTYEASRVVNAAGVGVAELSRMLGAELDIQAFPIQLSVTEPMAPLLPHLLYASAELLTLKQSHSGTILIGGGWPADLDAGGRPGVRLDSLARNLDVAADVVPALSHCRLLRSWAGIVNGTDSWLPILGELPGADGFFINYVPWMGFTGGPAGGRIVASLVQGRPPPVEFDVAPFAPGHT